MARGRDLTFSLLSDVSKFTTDAPARDLESLADSADDAGASLEDLDRARERLDLEALGTDAKQTARKVDDAFDAIARSTSTNARKIDGDTRQIEGSFRDVRDEALDTGREMGASFSGGVDDLQGAVQELAANAGSAFGPVGTAAAVAASVGVGLIIAEQQKIRDMATGFIEDMVEAGGRLTDAAIDAKILEAATEDPAAIAALEERVKALGISWRDYARAKYGDVDATQRVTQALADASTAITDNAAATGTATGADYAKQTALNELAGELGTTSAALRIAEEALAAVGETTDTTTTKSATLRDSWETTRGVMSDPITGEVKVHVSTPSPAQLDAIRRGLVRGIGPVVVNATARPLPSDVFYNRPRP